MLIDSGDWKAKLLQLDFCEFDLLGAIEKDVEVEEEATGDAFEVDIMKLEMSIRLTRCRRRRRHQR